MDLRPPPTLSEIRVSPEPELLLAEWYQALYEFLKKPQFPSGVRVGGATNYTDIANDGTITQSGTSRTDWTKKTAASVTVTVGGTDATSVVANLQTQADGNVFHLDEVAAAPAIDFYVEFTSITGFGWVQVVGQYAGVSTWLRHDMTIQVYNWDSTAWNTFSGLPAMNYDTTPNPTFCDGSFFVPSDTNYIGTGANDGKVRVRFVHFTSGNTNHDIYVDCVALYQ